MKRAVLLGVLAALAGVGLAACSGVLISRAALMPLRTAPSSFLALTLLVTTVRALGLGRAALRYAERLTGHAAALYGGQRQRSRLFARIAALGRDLLAFERAGDVLSRLNADTEASQMYRLRVTLPGAAFLGVWLLLTLWLWSLDAGLALLGGTPLLLAGLGVLLVRARAARLARARLHKGRDYGSRLLDALAASGDGAAGLHGPRLDALSAQLEQSSRREAALGQGLTLLQGSLFAVAVTGVVWRGVALVASDQLGGALLAAVVLAVAASFDAASALMSVPAAHAARQDALERGAELDHLSSGVTTLSPLPMPAGPLEMRLLEVEVKRGARTVLNGVTLTLHPGERLAISGPSGGGKTTLARLLTRDLDPSGGAVLLGDLDLRRLDPAALRARVSLHEQEAPLLDATLRENLLLGDHTATDERLRSLLDRLGLDCLKLDDWVGEGGAQLSGGQRARVSLARALLKPSELLILDEPTAHLDPGTEACVLAVIEHELAGRALLIITHRQAPLALAERHLRLEHCQLREHNRSTEHGQLRDGEAEPAVPPTPPLAPTSPPASSVRSLLRDVPTTLLPPDTRQKATGQWDTGQQGSTMRSKV